MTDLSDEFAGLSNAVRLHSVVLEGTDHLIDFPDCMNNWSVDVIDMTENEALFQLYDESCSQLPYDFNCIPFLADAFVVATRPTSGGSRIWSRLDKIIDDTGMITLTMHIFTLHTNGWHVRNFVGTGKGGRPEDFKKLRTALPTDAYDYLSSAEYDAAATNTRNSIYYLARIIYWLRARQYPTEDLPATGWHKSVSQERIRKGMGGFLPIRKVTLNGLRKRYTRDPNSKSEGNGTPKAPHDRSAHMRNLGERLVHVRASKIRGGRVGPTIISVTR